MFRVSSRLAFPLSALFLLTACGSSADSSSTQETSVSDGAQATPSTPATSKPPLHRADNMYIECSDSDRNPPQMESSLDQIWQYEASERVNCDVTFKTFNRNYKQTDKEKEAIDVAEYDDADSLDTLYSLCAESYLGDYEESIPWLIAQINEVRGALVLCPDHPERDEVEERMQKGEEDEQARESGEMFYDGTYRVGKDIPPGWYVTTSENGFENCYWERLDATGEIIDNNFIRNGFRAEVTISASDYSFSTDGCGEWRKQD